MFATRSPPPPPSTPIYTAVVSRTYPYRDGKPTALDGAAVQLDVRSSLPILCATIVHQQLIFLQ